MPQSTNDNRCRPRRPNPLAGGQDARAVLAWHRCREVCQPLPVPFCEERNDEPLPERQALDGLQCLDRSYQVTAFSGHALLLLIVVSIVAEGRLQNRLQNRLHEVNEKQKNS